MLASRLKLVGSSRNAGDEAAISNLKRLAAQLGIDDRVDFHVNVSFSELRMLLGNAVAGLHTMVDEHFGISVVEYMAAGEGFPPSWARSYWIAALWCLVSS